jgi:hypothetical protein
VVTPDPSISSILLRVTYLNLACPSDPYLPHPLSRQTRGNISTRPSKVNAWVALGVALRFRVRLRF